MTVRPAEAAIVRECARALLRGRAGALDRADLNERGVTSASGGQWAPQTSAPDARLAADQRPARAQGRDRRRRRSGRRSSAAEDGAKIRALLADPERRTNKAPAATCSAGCSSAATAASGWSRGRARMGSAATPARRGRGSPAAARPTSTPSEVERFVTEAVLHRLDSPELAAALERRSARQPDARALAGRRPKRPRRSSRSSPPPTGSSRSRWHELLRRAEADRAAADRRAQAARQGHRARACSTATSATAKALRARVGRARPQPAARDRRRRARLPSSSAPPGAATTASTSRA